MAFTHTGCRPCYHHSFRDAFPGLTVGTIGRGQEAFLRSETPPLLPPLPLTRGQPLSMAIAPSCVADRGLHHLQRGQAGGR